MWCSVLGIVSLCTRCSMVCTVCVCEFVVSVCGTAQLVCKAVWSNRRTRWSKSGKRPRQEGDDEYTSAQIHKPRGKDAEIIAKPPTDHTCNI